MIPKPLYEALPYIYMAIGLLASLGLDVTSGRASGLIMIFAGFQVWQLRKQYRNQPGVRKSGRK